MPEREVTCGCGGQMRLFVSGDRTFVHCQSCDDVVVFPSPALKPLNKLSPEEERSLLSEIGKMMNRFIDG